MANIKKPDRMYESKYRVVEQKEVEEDFEGTKDDDDAAMDDTLEIEMTSLVKPDEVKEANKEQLNLPKEEVEGGSIPSVCVNIFISFIGAGILGIPYALSKSGWLLGTLSIAFVAIICSYCMLLLVWSRRALSELGYTPVKGYGDLGRFTMGKAWGEGIVDVCIVVSQTAFVVAYLIFVAANIYSLFGIPRAVTIFACVPALCGLSMLRHLKYLTPASLIAQTANTIGLCIIIYRDSELLPLNHEDLQSFDLNQISYVVSVAVYCYEGMGMVLPLEESMHSTIRSKFPNVLIAVLTFISIIYILFGILGYRAFGKEVQSPITLNMSKGSLLGSYVKFSLSVSLYLTYPIMLFPVTRIIEQRFFPSVINSQTWCNKGTLFRVVYVLFTAILAYGLPDFGLFIGFIGSSICTLLAFIFPAYFHLTIFGPGNNVMQGKNTITWSGFLMDIFLLLFGIIFGLHGTYTSGGELLSHIF